MGGVPEKSVSWQDDAETIHYKEPQMEADSDIGGLPNPLFFTSLPGFLF
jgi:hypothetical protein